MMTEALPNGEDLRLLWTATMPFGKYKGRRLLDLPESYLLWFQTEGWPPGKLGPQMALALEIKMGGMEPMVRKAIELSKLR